MGETERWRTGEDDGGRKKNVVRSPGPKRWDPGSGVRGRKDGIRGQGSGAREKRSEKPDPGSRTPDPESSCLTRTTPTSTAPRSSGDMARAAADRRGDRAR